MLLEVEGTDAFSNEDSLSYILSSFAKISCNASVDGDEDTEAESLAAELVAEERLKESNTQQGIF